MGLSMDDTWEEVFDYRCRERCSPSDNTLLGARGQCRFCGRSSSETTFKKEAHVIAAALGNRTLFANEECDDCNATAGETMENHLVNSLSLARVFTGTRSRKGGSKLKIRADLDVASYIAGRPSETTVVQAVGDSSVDFELNEEEQELTVRAVVPEYRPALVAKSLARMLLFVLPEEELPAVEHLRRWVRGEIKWEPVPYFRVFMPGPQDPEFRLTVWRGSSAPFAVRFGNGSFSYILLVPDSSWALADSLRLPELTSTMDIPPTLHLIVADREEDNARACRMVDLGAAPVPVACDGNSGTNGSQ